MTEQEQAEAVVVGLAGFKVGDKVWAELERTIWVESQGGYERRSTETPGIINGTLGLASVYIVKFDPCKRFPLGESMSAIGRELSLRHD